MGKNLGELLSKIRLVKSFKYNDLITFKGLYDYIFLDFYFDDCFFIKTLSKEGKIELTEYTLSEFLEIQIEKNNNTPDREDFLRDLNLNFKEIKSDYDFLAEYVELNNRLFLED